MEPRRDPGPRRARPLRDPGRQAEAGPASRTCPSSATGAGTRARAATRLSTSARTRSTSTTGSSAPIPPASWPPAVASTTRRDARAVRHGHGHLRLPHAGGRGPGLLPDADDQRQQGLLRDLHGRPGHPAHLRVEVNDPGQLYRDPNAPAWDDGIKKGYVSAPKEVEAKEKLEGAVTDVRESVAPDQHSVPVSLRDPYHQPHRQNFFDAVRGKGTLELSGRDRLRERGQRAQGQRSD